MHWSLWGNSDIGSYVNHVTGAVSDPAVATLSNTRLWLRQHSEQAMKQATVNMVRTRVKLITTSYKLPERRTIVRRIHDEHTAVKDENKVVWGDLCSTDWRSLDIC